MCAGFQLQQGRQCWCGHSDTEHMSLHTPPPNPPLRGGITGLCTGFSPPTPNYTIHTICIQIGCRQSWLAHSLPFIPAPTAPLQVATWITPQPPSNAGTVNDRRLAHGRSLATISAFTPYPAGSRAGALRGGAGPSHHPFQKSVKANLTRSFHGNAQTSVLARDFLLVLFPWGPRGTTHFDVLDPAPTPKDVRVFHAKFAEQLQSFEQHRLIIPFSLLSTDTPIWLQLHRTLTMHALDANFDVSPHHLTLDRTDHMQSPWFVLASGNHLPPSQKLLFSAKLAGGSLTNKVLHDLGKKIETPRADGLLLLFFAPKSRLNGPLIPGGSQIHLCFGRHLLHFYRNWQLTPANATDNDEDKVECHQNCPMSLSLLPSSPSSHSLSASSSSSSSFLLSSSSGSSFALTGPSSSSSGPSVINLLDSPILPSP